MPIKGKRNHLNIVRQNISAKLLRKGTLFFAKIILENNYIATKIRQKRSNKVEWLTVSGTFFTKKQKHKQAPTNKKAISCQQNV